MSAPFCSGCVTRAFLAFSLTERERLDQVIFVARLLSVCLSMCLLLSVLVCVHVYVCGCVRFLSHFECIEQPVCVSVFVLQPGSLSASLSASHVTHAHSLVFSVSPRLCVSMNNVMSDTGRRSLCNGFVFVQSCPALQIHLKRCTCVCARVCVRLFVVTSLQS